MNECALWCTLRARRRRNRAKESERTFLRRHRQQSHVISLVCRCVCASWPRPSVCVCVVTVTTKKKHNSCGREFFGGICTFLFSATTERACVARDHQQCFRSNTWVYVCLLNFSKTNPASGSRGWLSLYHSLPRALTIFITCTGTTTDTIPHVCLYFLHKLNSHTFAVQIFR